MLFLLACSAPDDSAAPVVEGEPSPIGGVTEALVALDSASYAEISEAIPTACPDVITKAMAGYSNDPPVAADAHAEAYGAAPTPYHVHLAWTGDPSTSATVLWRTDYETMAAQIEIGPTEAYGTIVDGASFDIGTVTTNGRMHEVRVCGLPPGTTWHYRVGGVGGWSEDQVFTTAPPVGSRGSIRFGVAGDSRGSPSTWGQILAAMNTHGVDFRIFTGDAVTNGGTISQWDDWYDEGVGTFESVPTMMAHGNHEGNNQIYYALAGAPNNEEWYSFRYGNAYFASWNDTPGTTTDWQTQADWLAAELAATDATWKVTFHHKAGYSSCRPNGEDANVRTWFVPVVEAGGVQLDLAGHNHNYERTFPLAGGVEVPQADGTLYVVTAGAGAPMYDNNQAFPYTALFAESNHYVIVELDGDVGTLWSYDLAGNLLDQVSLVP